MGSAAAGERVRVLGQGPTPLSAGMNPKLSHYYVPVFITTHTFVLGSVAMATSAIPSSSGCEVKSVQ